MTHKKKLIEVALPLEDINRACLKDKNRKTGHIRNLHKWFAPMPLPAWRAILFAALIDDPGDDDSREELFELIRRVLPLDSPDPEAIQHMKDLIKSEHEELPVVVDPFCGGGSTLVEAQRLGLDCLGGDLNPIPVLITHALTSVPSLVRNRPPVTGSSTEISRPHGPLGGFLTDVTFYANRIREKAWDQLSDLFPRGSQGERIVAWRWALAVKSPDPSAKGALTPLVANWHLSKRSGNPHWIEPSLGAGGELRFDLRNQGQPPKPSISRRGGVCVHTGSTIPLEYIRREGREGRLEEVLLATIGKSEAGEWVYSNPTAIQVNVAQSANGRSEPLLAIPSKVLGFTIQAYGRRDWADQFTGRQFAAIEKFAGLIPELRKRIVADAVEAGWSDDLRHLEDGGSGASAYADAICLILALGVGRLAQANCKSVRWFIDPRNGSGKATPAFDRHVMTMVWDFVETNPFGGSVGDWTGPVLTTALRAFALVGESATKSQVRQADAAELLSDIPQPFLVATDPPYYANVGYAALSDFFYVWERIALREAFPSLTETLSTPKEQELVADPARHGGDKAEADRFFRSGFTQTFGKISAQISENMPCIVMYALRQQERGGSRSTGWEAFLESLIDGGLEITASWPIGTSTATRMRALKSNALASAICVVCRKRLTSAKTISRQEFLAKLRSEFGGAISDLQQGGVPPVDLAQASIGPGMSVFSRYSRVVETDGTKMSVGTALRLIMESFDEYLSEQEGELDSDTRFALTWYMDHSFEHGAFGDAETLAKARNVSVRGVEEAGILKSAAGRVRLLRRDELPSDWNPSADSRLTVWEITQHLIRRLERSEVEASELLSQVGSGRGDQARQLAYLLFGISERQGWANEAAAYNGLIVAWPELARMAIGRPGSPVQQTLGDEQWQ